MSWGVQHLVFEALFHSIHMMRWIHFKIRAKVEPWAQQNYPKVQSEIPSSMALFIFRTYHLHEFFHRWRIQEWHPPLPLLHCHPLSKQLHSCLLFNLHPPPSPSSCHLPSLQTASPHLHPPPLPPPRPRHPKTLKHKRKTTNPKCPNDSNWKELYLNLKYCLWVHFMFLGFNRSPPFEGSACTL